MSNTEFIDFYVLTSVNKVDLGCAGSGVLLASTVWPQHVTTRAPEHDLAQRMQTEQSVFFVGWLLKRDILCVHGQVEAGGGQGVRQPLRYIAANASATPSCPLGREVSIEDGHATQLMAFQCEGTSMRQYMLHKNTAVWHRRIAAATCAA